MTLAFYGAFFPPSYKPKWYTYSAVYLLHSWRHVELLSSRCMFSVHYTTMYQFTMSLHAKTNIYVYRVHLCLAVTYHLYFWQNDLDLLRATAVTRAWNGYRNETQHRNLTLEKNFSRCSYRDSNPRPLHHESITLPQSYSCSPQKVCYSGVPLAVTNTRAFLR